MGKKANHHALAPEAPKSEGGWRGKLFRTASIFEKFSYAAAAPLPSPRIRLWLEGFFRPEETYEKVESNATLFGVAGNLLLFYVAYSLVFFLFMLAFT